METTVFESMIGVTMTSVSVGGDREEMRFTAVDGRVFRFFHQQDCCEVVGIEDICGDLSDLVGSPIVQAEEVSSEPPEGFDPKRHDDSCTWTFYLFATAKGSVTVRWLGESNGYYSEEVSFEEVTPL